MLAVWRRTHASKREHKGRGGIGKIPVVALVERKGKSRSFHVANVASATLRPIMEKHASAKSVLMTDESPIYPSIGDGFAKHFRVNHSKGEYVDHGGYAHTNSAELHFVYLSEACMARTIASAKRICSGI